MSLGITAGILGAKALIKRLGAIVSDDNTKQALLKGGEIIAAEARILAPRETGLLEREIEVTDLPPPKLVGVGVRGSSPAALRARMTETKASIVGTDTAPRTSWPAKSKASATMPWLSRALVTRGNEALSVIRRALFRRD